MTLEEPSECVSKPIENQRVTILVTSYLTNGTKIGHLQSKQLNWHAHAKHDYNIIDTGKIIGTEVSALLGRGRACPMGLALALCLALWR